MNNRINDFRAGILAIILILVVSTTACGRASAAGTQFKTGPTQTVDIQVPLPKESAQDVQLNLEFSAGQMKLAPGASGYLATGASGYLATGTATFNVAEFQPQVDTAEPSYTVRQNKLKINDLPSLKDDFRNEWDLQLANTPMSLNIKAGGYTGNFELGGLSLEKLTIDEAGSDLTGSFSQPNQVEMSSFTFSTGGSKMALKGLANANFDQMTFNSGAGDYTLSFDGVLQRSAKVTIETGASTVNIIVPPGVSAQLTFDGGLSAVKAEGGWSQNGSVYTLSGSGPMITIAVKMGIGTLNLKTA